MRIVILILLSSIPAISFSQQRLLIENSCSYYGEKLPKEIYSFTSDNEAQTTLARIMNASGLPSNFKLIAGNVPNACAVLKYNTVTQSLDRYIIYNQTFMQKVKESINDWASISILAHEIGHHLSGHSLQAGGSRPELELEADKFSGFILQKLGATLEQSESAVNVLINEEGSSTHPGKSARLAAIANGWTSSFEAEMGSNKKSAVKRPLYLNPEELYIVKNNRKSITIFQNDYPFSPEETEALTLQKTINGQLVDDAFLVYVKGNTKENAGYFFARNIEDVPTNVKLFLKSALANSFKDLPLIETVAVGSLIGSDITIVDKGIAIKDIEILNNTDYPKKQISCISLEGLKDNFKLHWSLEPISNFDILRDKKTNKKYFYCKVHTANSFILSHAICPIYSEY
jgi:hypothetical protein